MVDEAACHVLYRYKKKMEREMRSNFADVRGEKEEDSFLIRVACTFDESRDKDIR